MAAGGSGEELARPEPTGYGHTDWKWVEDSGGVSYPWMDLRHDNEDSYEFVEWGENRDERHKQPARRTRPTEDVERLQPAPDWPVREGKKDMGRWTKALLGAVELDDLEQTDGVFSHRGTVVAVRHQNVLAVLDRPLQPYVGVVRELIAGAEDQGLRVERLDPAALSRYAGAIKNIERSAKVEGFDPAALSSCATKLRNIGCERRPDMATKVGRKASKGAGVPAGHKKIINELLVSEDAKPSGDVVRMAESDPRKEFARYQVPTDRGLKDIEIWPDRVKVRSVATYGFAKSAQNGEFDGLPDRVAPVDDDVEVDDVGLVDEGELVEGEVLGEGLALCIDISVASPEGMEEEEVISLLDEILRDEEISGMINERLSESGLSLTIGEVEPREEDEDDEFADEELGDEELDGEVAPLDVADEIVEPGPVDVGEACMGR